MVSAIWHGAILFKFASFIRTQITNGHLDKGLPLCELLTKAWGALNPPFRAFHPTLSPRLVEGLRSISNSQTVASEYLLLCAPLAIYFVDHDAADSIALFRPELNVAVLGEAQARAIHSNSRRERCLR
jgi:hypothetical protein